MCARALDLFLIPLYFPSLLKIGATKRSLSRFSFPNQTKKKNTKQAALQDALAFRAGTAWWLSDQEEEFLRVLSTAPTLFDGVF